MPAQEDSYPHPALLLSGAREAVPRASFPTVSLHKKLFVVMAAVCFCMISFPFETYLKIHARAAVETSHLFTRQEVTETHLCSTYVKPERISAQSSDNNRDQPQ